MFLIWNVIFEVSFSITTPKLEKSYISTLFVLPLAVLLILDQHFIHWLAAKLFELVALALPLSLSLPFQDEPVRA